MATIGNDIGRAKALLEAGDLVAIPTETVYGLAGNALDKNAVIKIFEVKNRPSFDPLIVHIPKPEQVHTIAENISEIMLQLMDSCWPGPLTILVDKKPIVSDLVTSGLPRVAVRCPNHPLTVALLQELPFPLAAPSANPFGYVSPTKPEHVDEQLGQKIGYILDGGRCAVGIESTIIGFENGRPVIYRLGGLAIDRIEEITGPVHVQLHSASNPAAPGQLKSHYAPYKRLVVGNIDELAQKFSNKPFGVLSFQKKYNTPYGQVLSPLGQTEEAAKNLFEALRSFDKMPVEIILAEFVPEEGLGKAINDRLRRAAVREIE